MFLNCVWAGGKSVYAFFCEVMLENVRIPELSFGKKYFGNPTQTKTCNWSWDHTVSRQSH